MSIDLKLTSISPLRDTYDHIAAKLGPGKSASRYQEAVWGLQPGLNFHYRPSWDQEHFLYDPRRTAITMRDFDDLVDPRQYYYGTWTIQRGRQQDSQERNFEFVEKQRLLTALDSPVKELLTRFVLPIRHIAWAANANNAYVAAYGYGAPLTSAASMQMIDELAVAQYVSRLGLLLADGAPALLDAAKIDWLQAPLWQGMRAEVEHSMVTRDWFELFVAQNFVIDALVHPLVFERFANSLTSRGSAAFALIAEFMVDWQAESRRWVDAVLRVAAAESEANKALLAAWIGKWSSRIAYALTPLAELGFGADGAAILDSLVDDLHTRARAAGIAL